MAAVPRPPGNARVRLSGYLLPVAIALLLIAAVWALVFQQLANDRQRAIATAQTNATNLSRAFEQHVLSTMQHFDSMVIHLRGEYLRNPTDFRASTEDAFWRTYGSAVTQLAIINAEGFLVYSNLAPVTTQVDLNDREHFRVQKEATEDNLFISKPVFGRVSQKWTIQLTRRIEDRDGNFRGVIVMSISPSDLSRPYTSIDIGQLGAISLVGADGVIRAWGSKASPPVEPIGSTVPADRPYFDPLKPASGIFEFRTAVDGILRIGGYRRLDKFPLAVVVLLAEEEVLANANARASSMAVGGFIVSCILFGGALVIGNIMERNKKSRSDLDRVNAELRSLAEIDPLTGVRNRSSFLSLSSIEIERQRRHGRPVSVAMIDMDGYKQATLRLGQQNADRLLAAVIAQCQSCLRPHDLIGRFHGEEFAILLPETELRQAREVLERLRASIRNANYPIPDHPPQSATISVGLTANVAGDTIDQMLSRADLALYQAKEQGPDRSVIA